MLSIPISLLATAQHAILLLAMKQCCCKLLYKECGFFLTSGHDLGAVRLAAAYCTWISYQSGRYSVISSNIYIPQASNVGTAWLATTCD